MREGRSEAKKRMKGAWTKEEDEKLISYIKTHGEGSWNSISEAAGLLRCGRSCRLRWMKYLKPDLKRGKFSKDEEDLMIRLHALLGNRWSLIAGRLPGRTDNEVMNHWNSHIRRRLLKMGFDPNNYRLFQASPPCQHPKQMQSCSKHQMLQHHLGQHEEASIEISPTRCTGVSSLPDLNLDP